MLGEESAYGVHFIPEARSASTEESVINHIFSGTGKAA